MYLIVKQCVPNILIPELFSIKNNNEVIEIQNNWSNLLAETITFHLSKNKISWESIFYILYNLMDKSPWEEYKNLLIVKIDITKDFNKLTNFIGALQNTKTESNYYKELRCFLLVTIYLYHLRLHYEKFSENNQESKILFTCPIQKKNESGNSLKRRKIDHDYTNESLLNMKISMNVLRCFNDISSLPMIENIQNKSNGKWLLFCQGELYSLIQNYQKSSEFYKNVIDFEKNNVNEISHISENWVSWIKLRKASNLICQEDHKNARIALYDILLNLPFPNFSVDKNSLLREKVSFENNNNVIMLFSNSLISIAIQTIQYLIWSYYETESFSSIIVLTQYAWPYFRNEFYDLIQSNEFKNGFRFPQFFSFIVNIDILEEFMFMLDSKNWNINILSKEQQLLSATSVLVKQVQQLHMPNFALDTVLNQFYQSQISSP